jgi:hypothetical protein
MADREALEAKWQENEAELNCLYSQSALDREQCGSRIDELEGRQDEIEWEAGREDVPPGSKHWSGLP